MSTKIAHPAAGGTRPSKTDSVGSLPTQDDEDKTCVELKMPDGTVHKMPLLSDVFGNKFIDVRRLHPTTGLCVFDPGFTSTASCESSITYIDGIAGQLLYRGYPIEQIAEEGDFYDAAFLLLNGDLPDPSEKTEFQGEITRHTLVHEHLIQFYKGFRYDAHPMAILCGVVGALSAFYSDTEDVCNPQKQLKTCYRLIAKMPTLAAMSYKTAIGQPIVYPRNDLSYTENFLHMMFAVPCEKYDVDPELARALEIIFILHLDHEQNASTTTVRTAGSSQANPFACIASGIAALWGPAHGGANEAVLKMLQEIDAMGGVAAIPNVIARARDRNDPFRLMGFGHRIYKTFDPRAKLMRAVCNRVLKKLGRNDPLLDLAMELEKVALTDSYFIERHLYPNVDFYSGIVLRALGIPIEMYTVMFAIARSVGWVAQWKELMSERTIKITRPRQIYVGEQRRDFVPVARRERSSAAKQSDGDVYSESAVGNSCSLSVMHRSVSTHVRNAMG